MAGFEPTTSSSRTKRATKLRHTPREATTAYRTRQVCCQIDIWRPNVPALTGGRTRLSDVGHATPRDGSGLSVSLCTMTASSRISVEARREMTGLGASNYVGFIVLAALWLFLTSHGPLTRESDAQGQQPDRSKSTSTPAAAEGSSPALSSHSSLK